MASQLFISMDRQHVIEFEEEVEAELSSTQKMPNCPCCKEDDLGVINSGVLMCYSCSSYFYLKEAKS
jgi:ribosomal protein L37AE/L43A